MQSVAQIIQAGKDAYKQGRYQEAADWLQRVCDQAKNPNDENTLQAQIGLAKAYQKLGRIPQATQLYQQIARASDPELRAWAVKMLEKLPSLDPPSPVPSIQTQTVPAQPIPSVPAMPVSATQRATQAGIKLPLPNHRFSLKQVMLGTLVVVLALLAWLCNGFFSPRLSLYTPFSQWFVAFSLTINLAGLALFVTPILIDITQRNFYKTRWISFSDLEKASPESLRLIQRICTQRKLKQPRIGLITDPRPLAFTYGSFPDNARIILTQGLLSNLNDDEIAAVIAHELGRILHWDFALVTAAAFPAQLTYMAYVFVSEFGKKSGRKSGRDWIRNFAPLIYLIYKVVSYPLVYLTRLGSQYADHFAAEATGNPNGLSRGLIKMAFGLQSESRNPQQSLWLLESTRILSVLDPQTVAACGNAYPLHGGAPNGWVFLWDLFSPWARWMQVNSTHPLPGQRLKQLAFYAERLKLGSEFNFGAVMAEGQQLDPRKLRGRFPFELPLYAAEVVGMVVGWVVGLGMFMSRRADVNWLFGSVVVGFGIGIMIKGLVMFPRLRKASESTIVDAISDPYASPLRSQPLLLQGVLFGQGQVGEQLGSQLMLQDNSGMIPIRYTSRFGPLGTWWGGMKAIKPLIGSEVVVKGWLRRSISPWVDIARIESVNGKRVYGRHRTWLLLFGGTLTLLGVLWCWFYRYLPEWIRYTEPTTSWLYEWSQAIG